MISKALRIKIEKIITDTVAEFERSKDGCVEHFDTEVTVNAVVEHEFHDVRNPGFVEFQIHGSDGCVVINGQALAVLRSRLGGSNFNVALLEEQGYSSLDVVITGLDFKKLAKSL